MANALVSSWLDYCNSLIMILSMFNLCKLQFIKNGAGRSVSNTSRFASITPVLKKLHWVAGEYCSVFKMTILIYRFLHTDLPKYFAPYLSSWSSSYSTRCS